MTKRTKWMLVAAIGVLIALIIVYPKIVKQFQGDEQAQAVQSAPKGGAQRQVLGVEAELVVSRVLTDKTVVTGSTMPNEQVDLIFEQAGKIVSLHFDEGAQVKQGQLLAKINDEPLQAELKKLEAQVPLAQERVYRQGTLLEKDAVSQEAYEQVTTELDKLRADIELVKSRIAQTQLRAPFDGVIGLRNVSVGAYASTSTVVSTLTNISPIKIDFSVPERYSSEMNSGVKVVLRLTDAQGDLIAYDAEVYAIESKIDEATRSLRVRAKYPNTRGEIISGRYASVEISRHEIADAIAVPSEALVPEMGKNLLFLYKSGVAEPVEVELGLRTEERVQILQGIQVGDTLITTGVMQLRKGTPVKLNLLK